MSQNPASASKSQHRAIRLLGLSAAYGTYAEAAHILTDAGYPWNGLPEGMTWRQAGKLSDATINEELRKSKIASFEDSENDMFAGPQC